MTACILNKIQQKSIYNKVTQWFHTCIKDKEHEGTPAETIMEMSDLFINLLKQKRLNLGVSETIFRRSICTALCSMKYYRDTNICKTRGILPHPVDWNRDLETMWQEWLEVGCFNNWSAVWARLPRREWEEGLPDWRKSMEHILMSHVQRDVEILIRENIVVEDDYGEYIDSNQYDYTGDGWE